MRVLMLSPLPPPVGGIASWTKIALSCVNADSTLDFHLLNTAVRWRAITNTTIWVRALTGGLNAAFLLLLMAKRLIFNRPDVVHLNTPAELGLIRDCVILLFCRVLRVPVVLHLHRGRVPDFPDLMKTGNAESKLVAFAVKLAAKVIVLNQPALNALRPYAADKLCILSNMVDMDELRDVAERSQHVGKVEKKSIVFVGHVIDRKGVFDLVEAGRNISARHPNFSVRMVGPYEEEIRAALIEKSGSGPNGSWLIFTGGQDRNGVVAELSNAAIFCLPSYAEGFPYVVLEAMALEKPIISSNVGAIPDMLSNGAGLCVVPGDIAGLENAIEQLIADPAAGAKLGNAAGARCRANYSSKKVFSQLKTIWMEAL